jgi:hypothetical protein
MDNNILAHPNAWNRLMSLTFHNIEESPPLIDFNQGLDCRLVTPQIADVLSKIKWIKYIRFACDTSSAVEPLMNAVELLKQRGIAPSRIFVYFLVVNISDAISRIKELRKLKSITLYAQPYRDFSGGEPISKEAYYFATKYVYSGQWRKFDWYDTPWGRTFRK